MSATDGFYSKKSAKGKFGSINMYQTDGFKMSNLSELKKPRSSLSPNRLKMTKSAKNNPILPMMKSYNNNSSSYNTKDYVN